MNLVIFALAGILLFLLFLMLNRISKTLVRKKLYRSSMMSLLPVIELVAWVAYAFWGIYVVFYGHYYYDLIVGIMAVLIIFGLAWFVFRDFLAGVLIKIEKAIDAGTYIKTPFAEGRIVKMGTLSLELVNDADETIKIPYSRLNRESLVLPPEEDDNLPNRFHVTLDATMPPEKAAGRVYAELIAMPWIIGPPPEVKIIKTPQGNWELQVKYHTHMHNQAVVVEKKIRELVTANNFGSTAILDTIS
jgi:small-conductance mechanosensitive channel